DGAARIHTARTRRHAEILPAPCGRAPGRHATSIAHHQPEPDCDPAEVVLAERTRKPAVAEDAGHARVLNVDGGPDPAAHLELHPGHPKIPWRVERHLGVR